MYQKYSRAANVMLRTMVTIAGLLTVCMVASSQPACRLECDTINRPFRVVEYITNATPECKVKIVAAVRACAGVWEIEIRSIELLDGCAGVDYALVRQRATSDFVRMNASGLPTDNAIWRVASPSCWQFMPPGRLVPCRTECCISNLRVEKRSDCATWSIVAEGRSMVRPTCPLRQNQVSSGPVEATAGSGCFFSCEPILLTK